MTTRMKLVMAVAALVVLLAGWRWLGHGRTEADENDSGNSQAAVIAAVAKVQRGSIDNSLTIAGVFKAFQEVDVHAKVAGYIRKISVDVGDHVKEGQTLAVLEIPELAAELSGANAAERRSQEEIRGAQGDLARSRSAHEAAHAMCQRLTQASQQKAGLVAQQEVDDAHAKDMEAEAQVASAEAALSAARQGQEVARATEEQYAALSNYARITAPFTGVVTQRYADTGALIAAGTSSSTQSMPVVKLAQVSKLRLVLPIPESLAAQIHLGDPVKVHVQALNTDIVGRVSRFAGALDLQTRTMETEIDFENPAGKLLPGMYAETVLQMASRKDVLTVPLEAVAQNAGEATVLALTPENKVEERKIKLGLQSKGRTEVLSGLKEGEQVIVGNRSQFREGEKVIPQEVKLPNLENGGAN